MTKPPPDNPHNQNAPISLTGQTPTPDYAVLDIDPPRQTRRITESRYAPGARYATEHRGVVVQYVIPAGAGDSVMRAMRRVAKSIDGACSTGHRVNPRPDHDHDEYLLFWVRTNAPVDGHAPS